MSFRFSKDIVFLQSLSDYTYTTEINPVSFRAIQFMSIGKWHIMFKVYAPCKHNNDISKRAYFVYFLTLITNCNENIKSHKAVVGTSV